MHVMCICVRTKKIRKDQSARHGEARNHPIVNRDVAAHVGETINQRNARVLDKRGVCFASTCAMPIAKSRCSTRRRLRSTYFRTFHVPRDPWHITVIFFHRSVISQFDLIF